MREIEFRPHIRVLLADNVAGIGLNYHFHKRNVDMQKKERLINYWNETHQDRP